MTSDTISPINSSQSRVSRIRNLLRQGKWPPPAHPFSKLLRLPPAEVQAAFKSPAVEALWEGVRNLLVLAEDSLRYESQVRKQIDTNRIYELRSLVDGYRNLLKVTEEIDCYGLALSEENGGTDSARSSEEPRIEAERTADEIEREISRRDDRRVAEADHRRIRNATTGY